MIPVEGAWRGEQQWSEKGEGGVKWLQRTLSQSVLSVVPLVFMYQVQLNLGHDRPLPDSTESSLSKPPVIVCMERKPCGCFWLH